MANTGIGNKNKSKNTPGLIDSYLQWDQVGTFSNNKRQSNVLSPPEDEKPKAKKKIIKHVDQDKDAPQSEEKPERTKGKIKPGKQMDGKKQSESNIITSQTDVEKENCQETETDRENVGSNDNPQLDLNNTTKSNSNNELKDIIGSLVEEMRSLHNTVHHDITDLQNVVTQQKLDITKLEESVIDTKHDIRKFLTERIDNNALKIKSIMDENKVLKRENEKLKERMCKLEKLQLENNVLISGQPEEAWETYDRTKKIVFDMITSSLSSSAIGSVGNVEIASCKWIGRYKMGRPRPISVTFHRKDDKQKLLENK